MGMAAGWADFLLLPAHVPNKLLPAGPVHWLKNQPCPSCPCRRALAVYENLMQPRIEDVRDNFCVGEWHDSVGEAAAPWLIVAGGALFVCTGLQLPRWLVSALTGWALLALLSAGIVDDVTFTSLSYGAEPETLPEGITECKFWWVARCCCCRCHCWCRRDVCRSVRTPAHPACHLRSWLHWHCTSSATPVCSLLQGHGLRRYRGCQQGGGEDHCQPGGHVRSGALGGRSRDDKGHACRPKKRAQTDPDVS